MERILICNIAHIGDLILASSVLPAIKFAYPDAEIGFLTSSWGQIALQDHLLIDYLHIFDHPFLNRHPFSRKRKKKIGGITWQKALQEIKETHYTIGIDIYSAYITNSTSLLYYADIPVRAGYWMYSNQFYLNRLCYWNVNNIHTVERHGHVLKECGIVDEQALKLLKPNLIYKTPLEEKVKIDEEYLVIHMGVGEKAREWNDASWVTLCKMLEDEGFFLVFIGSGPREMQRIEKVTSMLSNYLHLGNQLHWKELIPLIKKAKLLVGLESMSSHLAAALNTPCVSIYGGGYCVERWKPYTANCRLVLPPKECFNSFGYTRVDAIHKITPLDAYNKVLETLNHLGKT